ncbi:hypothetical protein E2C01_020337 [Portunus trituberculatus]|uniref:Uncharacterized protein n=1 Tax=Portunus trituberculatus TaxID=210409 RepID=A0A5B7DZM2_PORTR|nr:hypothetical protein [Portunus trituberculatus]
MTGDHSTTRVNPAAHPRTVPLRRTRPAPHRGHTLTGTHTRNQAPHTPRLPPTHPSIHPSIPAAISSTLRVAWRQNTVQAAASHRASSARTTTTSPASCVSASTLQAAPSLSTRFLHPFDLLSWTRRAWSERARPGAPPPGCSVTLQLRYKTVEPTRGSLTLDKHNKCIV